MEYKSFELMSKMYSEMQQGFKEVRSEMQQGFKDVRYDIVRIENKLDNNSKALFDGYKQTYEKLTDIEEKLEVISSKVEKQDVEIRVIKNVVNQ